MELNTEMDHTSCEPEVSILLATYASERYIGAQLDSIEQQSAWSKAELVVVVNEPGAVETEAIEHFRRRWPKQVQVMPVARETLYASWNRGIDAARGKILAIANVDDLRTPLGLAKQIAVLNAVPAAVFSFGTFEMVKEFGGRSGRVVRPPAFDAQEFTRSMLAGPFLVWKRAVDRGGPVYFDEQFRSGGDFDFAIRLACLGAGIGVDDVLGAYYDGGVGLSTGNALQPVERTVIELRYGIYDKVDYDYLPQALQYNVANLSWNGEWHRVAQCVPDYDRWMAFRRDSWFRAGIRRYFAAGHTRPWRRYSTQGIDAVKSWLRKAGMTRGRPK